MIIDGRAIAREILARIREENNGGAVVRAIAVAPNAATRSYLRIKERAANEAGMQLAVVQLPDDATTDDVVTAVSAPGADVVIVQLPLPLHIDEARALAAIPLQQDADMLSPAARDARTEMRTDGALLPPVAGAVREILSRAGYDAAGKRAVVIGKGRLVGEPVAAYLAAAGAAVEAFDVHTFTPSVLKDADIIVSGAGVPHLVTPEMLSEGTVLIDAGTSEQGGAIVGDIDPDCAPQARIYTPVPGGVGPITVACLFQNTAQLRKMKIAVH